MQMPSSQVLQEKWAPLLDYEGLDPIKDSHRRAVTAQLWKTKKSLLTKRKNFFTKPQLSTPTQVLILVSLLTPPLVVLLLVSTLF